MKAVYVFGVLGITVSAFLASCENDLKDVEKIAGKGQSPQIDKSYGVEILYSDSAVVKAKVITPLLITHKIDSLYYEMPKGATVIFFDENQKESSRIVSDYAVLHEHTKVVEMRHNVVGTSIRGDVFKSDELIWDPRQSKPIYSTKPVTITQPNGNIIFGSGFSSPENFKNWELQEASGNFPSGSSLIE